jgi:hypothetical protein
VAGAGGYIGLVSLSLCLLVAAAAWVRLNRLLRRSAFAVR